MAKKIIITESQFERLTGKVPFDPAKVLYVKHFLDSKFGRSKYGYIGADGDYQEIPTIYMKSPDGSAVKTFTRRQLADYLESKFCDGHHFYSDENICKKFLYAIISPWYEGKINKNGIIQGSNFF